MICEAGHHPPQGAPNLGTVDREAFVEVHVPSQDLFKKVRDACAWVLVNGAPTGSSYLAGKTHAVTCAHVVRDVDEGGLVTLKFPWGDAPARVEKRDAGSDFATLRLDAPATVDPLAWGETAAMGDRWIAVGYPEIANITDSPSPIVVAGEVRDPNAIDDWKNPALQLYCEDFAAGRGASPHGMSGSPVLIRERVVGHIKRMLSEDKRAELGLVYACPIDVVLKALPSEVANRPREKRDLLIPGSSYVPSWYVPREIEDRRAFDYAKQKAPIWIQGAWGTGMSWFLGHLLERLTATEKPGEGIVIVRINFQLAHVDANTTGDDLMDYLVHAFGESVRGRDYPEPRHQRLAWTQRLITWMEREILSFIRQDQTLVAVFEHAEELYGRVLAREFSRMLRNWVDVRNTIPAWGRILPITSCSIAPTALSFGESVGPSPVATPPIYLEPFNADQAAAVATSYGLSWSTAEIEQAFSPIRERPTPNRQALSPGYHPYLLAIAAYKSADNSISLDQIRRDAAEANGVFADALHSWLMPLVAGRANLLQNILRHSRADDADAKDLLDRGFIQRVAPARYELCYPIQDIYLRRLLLGN